MSRATITDPVTQFDCTGCGRIYNKELGEDFEGRVLCPDCFKEASGQEAHTPQETRTRQQKTSALQNALGAVRKAHDELLEAIRAEEAKIKKALHLQPKPAEDVNEAPGLVAPEPESETNAS